METQAPTLETRPIQVKKAAAEEARNPTRSWPLHVEYNATGTVGLPSLFQPAGLLNMADDVLTQKGRILVIDDDDAVLKSVAKILDREGYDVEIAPDGEAGIDMARGGHFDLVLCDIRMPGLDGIMTVETIRKIQRRAGRKHSAFLFMTAYAEEHERSRHLGLTEILRKPFGIEELRSAVEHNLRGDRRR